MRVTILGKHWEFVIEPVPGTSLGLCDPPDKPHKKITVDPKAEKKDALLMEVVLHEALHAACWSLDEDYVDEYARDAARLLAKLGFRRIKEDE